MHLSLVSVWPCCVVQPVAVLRIGVARSRGACLPLGCEVEDGDSGTAIIRDVALAVLSWPVSYEPLNRSDSLNRNFASAFQSTELPPACLTAPKSPSTATRVGKELPRVLGLRMVGESSFQNALQVLHCEETKAKQRRKRDKIEQSFVNES